jgi:hypothetical protein
MLVESWRYTADTSPPYAPARMKCYQFFCESKFSEKKHSFTVPYFGLCLHASTSLPIGTPHSRYTSEAVYRPGPTLRTHCCLCVPIRVTLCSYAQVTSALRMTRTNHLQPRRQSPRPAPPARSGRVCRMSRRRVTLAQRASEPKPRSQDLLPSRRLCRRYGC